MARVIGKAFKIKKSDIRSYGYAKPNSRGRSRMTPNAGVTAIAAINGRGSWAKNRRNSARSAMSGLPRPERLRRARKVIAPKGSPMRANASRAQIQAARRSIRKAIAARGTHRANPPKRRRAKRKAHRSNSWFKEPSRHSAAARLGHKRRRRAASPKKKTGSKSTRKTMRTKVRRHRRNTSRKARAASLRNLRKARRARLSPNRTHRRKRKALRANPTRRKRRTHRRNFSAKQRAATLRNLRKARRAHSKNASPKRRRKRKAHKANAAPKRRRRKALRANTTVRRRRRRALKANPARRKRRTHRKNTTTRRRRRRVLRANPARRKRRTHRKNTTTRRRRTHRRNGHMANHRTKRRTHRKNRRSTSRRSHRRNGMMANRRGAFRKNAFMATLTEVGKIGLLTTAGFGAHKVLTEIFSEQIFDRFVGSSGVVAPPAAAAVHGLEMFHPYRGVASGFIVGLAGVALTNKLVKDVRTKMFLTAGIATSFLHTVAVSVLGRVMPHYSGYLAGHDGTAASISAMYGLGAGSSIQPHYAPIGEYFAQNGVGEYFAQNGFGEYGANPDLMQAAAGYGIVENMNSDHINPGSDLDQQLSIAEAAAGVGAMPYQAAAGMGRVQPFEASAGIGEYFAQNGFGAVNTIPPTADTWIPGGGPSPQIWAGTRAISEGQSANELDSAGILETSGNQGVFG